jgi:phosphatidylinositol glycan class A protein
MVEKIRSGQHQPRVAHARLVNMYTWSDVAARTEQVYSKALNRPERDISERMWRYAIVS